MEETKTLKIEIPEGYEIDEEKSTFENIVFKKVENKFSKNWKEFCDRNSINPDDAFISNDSLIIKYSSPNLIDSSKDKNIIPFKFAKPMLALMQLLTIREKEYTKGWEPNYSDFGIKYTISVMHNKPVEDGCYTENQVLTFPTAELRDEFLENWKDLIEIAKPLL